MEQLRKLAEVIVSISNDKVNRLFTYIVPQHLEGKIQAGYRAIVPFGNRKIQGYIVRIDTGSYRQDLKEIINLPDPEPLIAQKLIDMAFWMADYYHCPVASCFNAFLPKGIEIKYEKSYSLKENIDVENIGETLSEKQKDVLEFIAGEGGKLTLSKLKKHISSSTLTKILNTLTEVGMLAEQHSIVNPRVQKKMIRVICLSDTYKPDMKSNFTEKQQKVLTFLERSGDGLTATELAKQTGVTTAVISALEKKGVLEPIDKQLQRDPWKEKAYEGSKPFEPTPEQKDAIEQLNKTIDAGEYRTFLLNGVTGSGKTEVYLQTIARLIKMKKQAIVLVPEISLTPQMVRNFKARFQDAVAVLHSRLSLGERLDEWWRIKTGEVSVVVGARSAIFAPFNKLGLVIIDEEHETSYKQDDSFGYHARDIAIYRAKQENAVVVLGSATPSLESYYRALEGEYTLLALASRIDNRPLPEVQVVDMREEIKGGNKSIFCSPLQEAIETVMAKKEQAILFLNRRGYATFILCRECGFVMKCPHCDVSLTFHSDRSVRCHYCNHIDSAPDVCPNCRSTWIRHFGTGTQRVEEEVKKLFPSARVARMDVDTTTQKDSHYHILEAFRHHKHDILVGTQMIAKGLDFERVTLVGVITADTILNLPDFRAAEKTFQLMTQVAGRAGRGILEGRVIVQTYTPEHYSIQTAREHDYRTFYEMEIEFRRQACYPPFAHITNFTLSGENENEIIQAAETMAHLLRCIVNGDEEIEILGPSPAPLSLIKGYHRWQFLLKTAAISKRTAIVNQFLTAWQMEKVNKRVKVSIDVDPQWML